MPSIRVRVAADELGRASVRLEVRRLTWATLVTTDSYVRGVACLARSLRQAGSAHPLLVLATPNLSKASLAALESEACSVRVVPRFDPFGDDAGAASAYVAARFADCWTKLRLWQLAEFERIGYLDADMLVLRKLDEILEWEAEMAPGEDEARATGDASHAHAPRSDEAPRAPSREQPLLAVHECLCFCEAPERRLQCPYRPPSGWARGRACAPAARAPAASATAARPVAAASAAAAALGAALMTPPRGAPAYFNAGLLVLTPDARRFESFGAALRGSSADSLRWAEQDFLNGWYAPPESRGFAAGRAAGAGAPGGEHVSEAGGERRQVDGSSARSGGWLALPHEYNATKTVYAHHRRGEDGLWVDAAVRNLHFTHAKPWDLRARGHRGYGRLNRLWWSTYLLNDAKLSAGGLQRVMLTLMVRARAHGAPSAGPREPRAGDEATGARAAAPAPAPGAAGPCPPSLSDSSSDCDDESDGPASL
ncbi:hypothetical protein KFE25_001600 [Diacronema lutheri]|uniref:Hexosyltransferase n=1 Tax=Diacronema lutheri TaxID=2081491 RepID=A0A8J5XK28_DIALT|nr:hypothetical protein KFE25_001600 [Diacronema lutheri]